MHRLLLALLALSLTTACSNSRVGLSGDLNGTLGDDADVGDRDGDAGDDGMVIACQSDEDCADALPLGACQAAICDMSAGECRIATQTHCCETEADCPIVDDPCVSYLCPRAGGTCEAVDLCPPCDSHRECERAAPPCTIGQCQDGTCAFEPSATCCHADGDCDDADDCTANICDRGQCRYRDEANPSGAPTQGCCAATPALRTSFSPGPDFEANSTGDGVAWQVIPSTFTPSPRGVLYMGNPDTRSAAAHSEGGYDADARFALGPVVAGADVEVKLFAYLDLRPAPGVDRFQVLLRGADGAERLVYSKSLAPLGEWHAVKRAIRWETATDALTLVLRFESVEAFTDSGHLGILVDDLQVRTACGEAVECQTDAQCPSPLEPCQVGRCRGGACVEERDESACDDGDPCTEDRFGDSAAACIYTPIAGCCVGPNCGACRPDVAQWDFDGGDQGWTYDDAVLGFGWERVRVPIDEQPEVLYFGNWDTGSYDPGFPLVSAAQGPVVQLPSGASQIGVRFGIFAGVDSVQAADEVRLEATGVNGEQVVLWAMTPMTPRWEPTEVAVAGLEAFAGQPVSLRFVYEGRDDRAQDGLGLFIDDVAIVARCGQQGCQSAAQCDDGDGCTEDVCRSDGACLNPPIPGCGPECSEDTQCDDRNPCTQDLCTAEGVCAALPIPNCGGCTATGCDDGDPCTVDRCRDDGICAHAAIPGCGVGCDSCFDGDPCTEDVCQADGQCVFRAIAGCCSAHVQCADGDTCTRDRCRDHTCRNVFVPERPGCGGDGCEGADDCADDDLCTEDICTSSGSCLHPSIPGCCQSDESCVDGDRCTVDKCADHQCVSVRDPSLPGCGDAGCQAASDCVDDSPCTENLCASDGTCFFPPIPGCCTSAATCRDGDPCTRDVCEGNLCDHIPDPTLPNCGPPPGCERAADCDDGDPCTADSCNTFTGQCEQREIPGCCTANGQCGDGDFCTVDYCDANRCFSVPAPFPGCVSSCQADSDCGSSNPCTTIACVDGVCEIDAQTNCCGGDADCDDGNACTQDTCLGAFGACASTPIGCNDNNPCTVDRCDPARGCVFEADDTCCAAASDCDDGDACTADGCVSGRCEHLPQDSCCEPGDPNCCPPGDASCCQPTDVWQQDFEAETLPEGWRAAPEPGPGVVTWRVSAARHDGGSRSIYMGNPETGNYDNGARPRAMATSGLIDLPEAPTVVLSWSVWLDVEPGEDFDPFWVDVVVNGQAQPVWSKTAVPEGRYRTWVQTRADLSSFAGQTVRLRLRFAADDPLLNETEGIYVDSMAIRSLCR